MGELEGRVALITGGSRGIGRRTAELMAAEGASLALLARTQEALDAAAEELRARYGVPVLAQSADITRAETIEAYVRRVDSEFGRLDVLVNNAGESSQHTVDAIKRPVSQYDSVGGAIVNIISTKGSQPAPRVTTSGSAWAAGMNMSKALSMELGPYGIRVNVVSVGNILTPNLEAYHRRWGADKTIGEFFSGELKNLPLRRLGTAEEVAQAILYLASPRAAYTTGQILAVDGGGVRAM